MNESNSASAVALLKSGARALRLDLSRRQIELFEAYCSRLIETNRSFNLTAFRTPEDVMQRLIVDSLSIAPYLPRDVVDPGKTVRAVDVGTGSGAPGLPLKILFPAWSFTFVESVQKKARFLSRMLEELGLEDVAVEARRAEEVAWLDRFRDAADLCFARAVAALPALIELCSPFVRSGGFLVFPKSGDVSGEIATATAAARALRVECTALTRIPVDVGLGDDRYVVIYRKVARTPEGYPRRIGLATSRPLGGSPA